MTFNKWLDTFIAEKGIDGDHMIEADGASGANYIPVSILVDAIKSAGESEKAAIKNTIVKIDFHNGNVMHFFSHLAKAIAI